VYASANVSIPHNAQTPITFNSERHDYANLRDAALPTRLAAPEAGVYDVQGRVVFAAAAGGNRSLSIVVNAVTFIASEVEAGSAAGVTYLECSTQYEFAAGDYARLLAFQNQTTVAALNVNALPNYSPEFSMTRVA
jgi:hypothetical protein